MKLAHRLAGIVGCTLLVLGLAAPGASASSLTVTSENTTEHDFVYMGVTGNADVAGRIWIYLLKDRTDCPADVGAVKGDLGSVTKDIEAGPISIPFQYGFGLGAPAAGQYLLCGYFTAEQTNASTPAPPVSITVAPLPPGNMLSMNGGGGNQLLGQVNIYCYSLDRERDCPTTGTVSWRTNEAGRKALKVHSKLLASGPVKPCGEGVQCAILGGSLSANAAKLARRTQQGRPVTVKLTLTVHLSAPRELTWTVPFTARFSEGGQEERDYEDRCSTSNTDQFRCLKNGKPDQRYKKPPKYPRGPDSDPSYP